MRTSLAPPDVYVLHQRGEHGGRGRLTRLGLQGTLREWPLGGVKELGTSSDSPEKDGCHYNDINYL